MTTNPQTPKTASLGLLSFAIMGIIVFVFFLMAEIQQPEYLIYFAPILGLVFYGSYYIINHKLDRSFLHGAYNKQESLES
jgi:hypothetical protein